MKDELGNRMKSQYEDRTRFLLPRRTYTILRIDGKAFHTFTRSCVKPFDYDLMADLDSAALALCEQAMGVRCAYGQSDEYSFLLTDFETIHTESWFDGNVQKIASVAASIFTAYFPRGRAAFDARVFTIPDPTEVENYFIWRRQNATRNAILSAGYAEFSPKQLHGKNTSEVQEMLFRERGINFNDYPTQAKRGRVAWRETYQVATLDDQEQNGPVRWCRTVPVGPRCDRSRWVIDREMPILTQDRGYFAGRMRMPQFEERE